MTNRLDIYNKSVDILFQAYFEDSLRHSNCSACAVGNLIVASNNCKLDKSPYSYAYEWPYTQLRYNYGGVSWYSVVSGMPSNPEIDKLIEPTGYSWKELAMIEHAFERAPRGKSDEDWMYNGLVAVLDVLKEIHGVTDQVADSSKIRFNNHYQLLIQ